MSHSGSPNPYDVAGIIRQLVLNPWCHDDVICAWLKPDSICSIGFVGHPAPLVTLRVLADGQLILCDRNENPLVSFRDCTAAYKAMLINRKRQIRIYEDLLTAVLQFEPEFLLPTGSLSRNEKRVVA